MQAHWTYRTFVHILQNLLALLLQYTLDASSTGIRGYAHDREMTEQHREAGMRPSSCQGHSGKASL